MIHKCVAAVVFAISLGDVAGRCHSARPTDPATTAARDWKVWRKRVQDELAALPKPPAPANAPVHPIDAFLADWWTKSKLHKPRTTDDAIFARRTSLDIIGLLPDEKALDVFLGDKSADKRARWIERLLGETTAYAEHWMTFWNDLLRNDEQTNIDNLRKPITPWLFRSLRENKPFDQMVAELLDPSGTDADGFLIGVNWRGAVNHSQTAVMQAAQTSAQLFLGVNLKCASCHDHFLRDWTLDRSHAYAAFFAEGELELYRCDKPTGVMAVPGFLFDGMGEIDPSAGLDARRAAVAIMVTRPKNPRFARVLVNRLFKKLIGQGLIDRPDDLDFRTAFAPDLFEWLADDFMRNHYDLKHVIRLIATSQVYQQIPADTIRLISTAETRDEPPFVGPRLRRMTAEQFLDGVFAVTGFWPKSETMSGEVPNPNVRAWRHRKPTLLVEWLGRPNREQVCSDRIDEATVLQALELVNGETLAGYLQKGATVLLDSPLGQTSDLQVAIDALCRRAYSRRARPDEVEMARSFLGQPSDNDEKRRQGWEDVLWMIFMSPEFQFIQ